MGSLEPEPEIESNEIETMVDSPTTSDKNDDSSDSDGDDELVVHSPPIAFNDEEKASCSSSSMSSTDFTVENPFHESEIEHSEKSDYTIESPRIQVMERANTDERRIPSSVFGRRESANFPGWGLVSNDSLFSINMGGVSFGNQDSLASRYRDLDLVYSIEPSPCGTPIEIDMILEADETDDSDSSDDMEGRNRKLGEVDKIQSLSEISNNQGSRIAEPVKLRENREDEGDDASVVEELKPHFAAESGNDRSSFAFPILTAGSNKAYSSKINGTSNAKPEQRIDPQPNSEPDPNAEPGKQTHPFGPKADTSSTSWTKCFGCCTNC